MRRRDQIRFLRGFLLALGLTAAGCAGGGIPTRPTTFCEKLARATFELGRSARQFRQAVTPLKTGQPASDNNVNLAFTGMETALKNAKEISNKIRPPTDSKSGPKFLEAYRAFLNDQESLLQNQLRQARDVALDAQQPPAQRWEAVLALFNEVDAAEKPSQDNLNGIQNEFRVEHNLTFIH